MRRCEWAKNELYIAYHDHEWGVPVHDDRDLFEFLILEGMQAGLSWETILRKRDNYRAALDNFEVSAVASYKQPKVRELLTNPGIIRNRLKIEAAVQNARLFLDIQKEFGSFDAYVWEFVSPTICYALMQAVGMVNDHLVHCFRHKELREEARLARIR